MRKIAALLLALVLSTSIVSAGSHDVALAKAKDLYVKIACTGPTFGFHRVIGTGYPVSEYMVFTAKHIDCGPRDITEISRDGYLWETIETKNNIPHGSYDLRAYRTHQKFTSYAHFRAAALGEDGVGFGIADGDLMTVGTVVKITDAFISLTNFPVGGMSGSAVIGENGDVIGMTVQGRPEFLGEYPATFVTDAVPAQILEAEFTKLAEALAQGQ